MKAASIAVALFGLALVACGGGRDATTTAAREPRDPRTVPTATLPPQLATPIPALDASQPQGRPTAPPDVYVVKAGDTPAGIAADLGVDLAELLRINSIDDPRGLKVGQQLKVPRPPQPSATPGRQGATAAPSAARTSAVGTATTTRTSTATATPGTATGAAGSTYTVQSGDTACAIAQRLGVPLTALAEANGTTVAELANLRIGQVLKFPSTRGPAGC